MSIEPEESCLQTQINQINRVKKFVQSDEFCNVSALEIEQKREFLDEAYRDFIKERNKLIHFAPKSMFEEQDKKVVEVEEVYHKVGLALRQQLKKRETEEAKKKMRGKIN